MAKGKFQKWLDGLTLLEGWARDGLTDEQIASNCGITATTLYDWKNRFPEISETLKRGKEVVDIQVENALLKRALGYEYTEERIEVSEKDGRKVVQTVKAVVPDTTAQIFWLKNRRPDKWRDKPPEASDTSRETETPKLLHALQDGDTE
ncbi:MAG: helix-turn-helix domain-containing protein [Bacillota bacterium]